MNKIEIKVSVIGLGYVGLPLALVMANNEANIYGYDIDINKIDKLNKGVIFLDEKELISLWKKNHKDMIFSNELKQANVYLIAVPTPLLKNQTNCDLSFVETAVKKVSKILKINDIVILVSTSPVGTTKVISNLITKISNLKAGKDFFLAYCPERLYPGDTFNEIINNDHIIGGFTQKCSENIAKFYRTFISKNTNCTRSTVAELAKLAENSFRDINIAFANELAEITLNNKEDINNVINLANMHPRVNILKPGIGVGGHCLPIDPWFLTNRYQKDTFSVIRASRRLNDQVPLKLARRIIQMILQNKNNSTKYKYDISFLGYTYKKNSSDLRESPAKIIIEEVINHNFRTFTFDPLIETQMCEEKVFKNLNNSRIVILLVEHDSLKSICKKVNFVHWKEII